jgi:ATP-dependent helicase/nuclease subunit B
MRKAFGLPAPERRIGLSAHDFAQAFCAPEVVLTRSERVDGAPTVPSRWLLRLDAALAARGLGEVPRDARWLAWHAALGRADTGIAERPRPPSPRPPLAARPRELPVTQVEMWRRDPYALYARRILRLKALEPIDADPDAADRGTIIHRALDAFIGAHPAGPLPPDALARVLEAGRAAFGAHLTRPGVWAFWWPRFERIARWFVAHEAERRAHLIRSWSEVKGALRIDAPLGAFTLTATADRIDRLTDGSLVVIDYKTGSLPSAREVAAGFAPQLPLEGAIAASGGFQGVAAGKLNGLLFWRLTGGRVAGEERDAVAKSPPGELADQARAGLTQMIEAFDDPATRYEARPHPARAPRYSDYLHLARVAEWSDGEGDGGE